MAYDNNSAYRPPNRSYYSQNSQEAPHAPYGQHHSEPLHGREPRYQQKAAVQQIAPSHTAYGQPARGQPTYNQPAYGQHSYDQPAYDERAYNQSAYYEPTYDQPAYNQSAHNGPQYDQPVDQQLAYRTPGPQGSYHGPPSQRPNLGYQEPVYDQRSESYSNNDQSYGQVDGHREYRAVNPPMDHATNGVSRGPNGQPYNQHHQTRQGNGRSPQPAQVPHQPRPPPSASMSSQGLPTRGTRDKRSELGPQEMRRGNMQEQRADTASAHSRLNDVFRARDAQAQSGGSAADRTHPQDRTRNSPPRTGQIREKSAPPARRKPLIEPPSDDVMPQDTAFPTFPTKKEAAKAKIRDSTGASSTNSRNSGGEHVRPATAGGTAASSRRFQDSGDHAKQDQSSYAPTRHDRSGLDDALQHGPSKQQKPFYGTHQLNGPENMMEGPQMSTMSLPERNTAPKEASWQQDAHLGLPHRSAPVQNALTSRSVQDLPSNGCTIGQSRPVARPMVTSRSLTHQHAGYVEPRQESAMSHMRSPVITTGQHSAQQPQPRRHPNGTQGVEMFQGPRMEQQYEQDGYDNIYDDYYVPSVAPQKQTASMVLEAKIEAEMPDFDNASGPPKPAHHRGKTIDRDLDDIHPKATPPPLPTSGQSLHQHPPAPAYVKPAYQDGRVAASQPITHKSADIPSDMSGFVFDVPDHSMQYPPQDSRYQSPAPMAEASDPRRGRVGSPPGAMPVRSQGAMGYGPVPHQGREDSRQAGWDPRTNSPMASTGRPQYPPQSSQDGTQHLMRQPAQGQHQDFPSQSPMQRPPQHHMQHAPQYPAQNAAQHPIRRPAQDQQYSAQSVSQHPQRGPMQDPRHPPLRTVSSEKVLHPAQAHSPRQIQQQQSQQQQQPPQSLLRTKTSPDALPQHPTPVRPGLMDPPLSQAARPPPVRHHDQAVPSVAPTSSRPSMTESRGSVDVRRQSLPVTPAELAMLRTKVEKNPKDNKTALVLAKKLVEASSVLASENGRLDAKSTAKNQERYILDAHKRIKRLVAAGYPEAMFYLADCYGQGMLGLQVDTKEAFSLYQSAAKAGHAGAAFRTAVCCEIGPEDGGGTRKDPLKAVQWYRRAAQLHDNAAMYKLGVILLKGLLGQPKNIAEAVVWLKKAADVADADNPHALHELAKLHETGNTDAAIREKVTADDKYARELYAKAASFGYKFSQFRLGQAYEYRQLGLPMDARMSIGYYSKAAAQGEHGAELALSGWYLTGAEGILEHSEAEAYLWARKAAVSSENGKAMYAMGYYSENGIGCPANLEDAKRWYGRAASLRFPKAQERLEELRKGKKPSRSKAAEGRAQRDQKRDEAECVVM